MKICIAGAVLAAMLLCVSDASAQSKAERVFDKLYPYSVAAEIGSIIVDGESSRGLKAKGWSEKSGLFQDSEKYFSATKYYWFNGALAGGKYALVHFFPRLKPYVAAFNLGVAVRHSVAGVSNFRAPNRFKLTLGF